MGEVTDIEALVDRLTAEQSRLLQKRGRYFTTSQAMSLPLLDIMRRAGSFNRWVRTPLGIEITEELNRRSLAQAKQGEEG